MSIKILKRGAEAVIYLEEREGRRMIIKERVRKAYRVGELDEKIRKQRTRSEASLMAAARRAGVNVPLVQASDGKARIEMDYIDDKPLKNRLEAFNDKERQHIYALMAGSVAKLHASGIIHGDLTTSNMLFSGGRLYLLDFGLAKKSARVEDQATDLFLLLEAMRASHHRLYTEAAPRLLNAYRDNYVHAGEVIKRLSIIEKRRRYKPKADA